MAFRRMHLFLVIALSVAPMAALTYQQGAKVNDGKKGYQAPTYLIDSLEGRDLFRAYCAACHGADARGGGPAAASLKSSPPDLTRIAQRRGGVFPLAEVEKIIAGEESAAATHGMREMPIWGPILGQVQRDQSFGKVRIRNLATYLESLQVKSKTALKTYPKREEEKFAAVHH